MERAKAELDLGQGQDDLFSPVAKTAAETPREEKAQEQKQAEEKKESAPVRESRTTEKPATGRESRQVAAPAKGAVIRSNGAIAVKTGMTESELESLRETVAEKSTEYLERSLGDKGQLPEFKELAREELARRKAAPAAPASPKSPAPTPAPATRPSAFAGNAEAEADFLGALDAMWLSRELEEGDGSPHVRSAAEIDAQDGTNLQGICNLVNTTSSRGKRARGLQGHYKLSKTADIVKKVLRGDYFTVQTSVVLEHFGKDPDHSLTAQDWVNISEALHDPLVIARYSFPGKNGARYYPPNSFRVWVEAVVNGHWAMVGVEVKSPAKDISVNSVSTVYGDETVSLKQEDVVYSRGDGEGVRTLLGGPNPREYSEPPSRAATIPHSGADVKRDPSETADALWMSRDLEGLTGGGGNGIVDADEREDGKNRHKESASRNPLGIPRGAMPDRGIVDTVREILKKNGEGEHGTTVWGGRVTPETAEDLFRAFNSDEETERLFNRVFPVSKALGLEYSFAQYDGYKPGRFVMADYVRRQVRLYTNMLFRKDRQTFASSILHEMIHGITVYAMELTDGTIKNPKTRLTGELNAAAKEIFSIYNKSKDWMGDEYGATDAYEMIAELANPRFRASLKEKDIWGRILDAIRRILGFREYDLHDATLKALDRFIENYDADVFDSYLKDSYRNDIDVGMIGINTRFSIRKSPPPKKTGIGYKVFFRKGGKLYPPMVANPGGADTPVGVWLDADAAPVAGTSKTGRPQVRQGGKGTQGGSGMLAYRPGWHLGEIPYALQFNRRDENGERTLFPRDFVWAEVEYAADADYQKEAEAEGYTGGGKFRHSYAGLKRVPENGFYRYRTNPDPRTDEWIITGAMKVNRVLSDKEVDDLVRKAGHEPQRREPTGVRWMSRELEGRTDEEREAHNLLMGVRAVRAFAKAGGTHFGDFAATVRAYRPEVYGRVKQFLPGMWLNARLGGMRGLEEATEAQYGELLDMADRGFTYDRAKGRMVEPAESAGGPARTETTAPAHATRGEAISAAADEIIGLLTVDCGLVSISIAFDLNRQLPIDMRHTIFIFSFHSPKADFSV